MPRSRLRPAPLLWKLMPVVAGSVVFHVWRSQELLLFVASTLIAAAAVSALAGRYFASRLDVRADWPETAHAGTHRRIRLRVRNGAFLPSPPFSVRATVGTATTAEPARAGVLPSEEPSETELELAFAHRGVHGHASLELEMAPLGLVRTTRCWDVPVKLVIHPRVWVLGEKSMGAGSPFTASGSFCLPIPGHDVEFLGVREYQPGDSPRMVHWATSARRQKLHVKEFTRVSRTDVTLLADLSPAAPWTDDLAETLVTAASSLVHLFRRLLVRYQLLLTARRSHHVRFGLGQSQYLRSMHALTQASHGAGTGAAGMLQSLSSTLGRPSSLILVTAFPSRQLLDVAEMLHRRGVAVTLLAPWLSNLPQAALREAPTWEPLGTGGRELSFPVLRFTGGEELDRHLGRLS